ncbi:MAG: TRAP transporter small permease [Burkholderiales bacterium]|jgi:TRAP-type C4-dicarboxylate transport system permease small subunit|nr:TRAP transporter small permease [Burkholderiales bacterium]
MLLFLEKIRALVRWTSLFLLFLLIATPLAQVIMRGVFNVPMSGAEELARYFLICLSFLAASYVTREGGQICMEEIQAFFPDRIRWWTQIIVEISGVVFFTAIGVSALITISRNLSNQTATLEMPFPIFMAPLAIGMFLLAIETFIILLRLIQSGQANAKTTNLT